MKPDFPPEPAPELFPRDALEQAKAVIAERVVVRQQLSDAAAEYERVHARKRNICARYKGLLQVDLDVIF